jgi:chemotaxis protein methyltransferase CheR
MALSGTRVAQPDDDLETIEIQLLLEGIRRHYGFDFTGYALGSLRRRLWQRAHAEGLASLSALQERVLHDPACMQRLLHGLSINVTAMFRDPGFYLAFRRRVVPHLRTYPFIRIWSAGCSTGEETYSLAILLQEEGLYDRTRIYATDINETVLAQARAAVFPLEKMREYTKNYIGAGGVDAFSRYYVANEGTARLREDLRANVVFAQHNLASDRAFNHFNVILCRNVLIYFGKPLQDRVHELFYESLETFGVLALGQKESIRYSPHEGSYSELDGQQRLFRKER